MYELETADETDITYGDMEADPRTTSPEVTYYNSDAAVVYSEVQNTGGNAHTVAPSGDLYANASIT